MEDSDKDHAFHDRYLWDPIGKKLYFIGPESAWLCIPRGPVQLQLLKDSHDCLFSGHPGLTFSNLSQHFFWPRMSTDVKNFVRSCEFCQRNKSERIKAGLLQPLPVPESPWSVISMDLIMGLPKTGCGYDAILHFC